MTELLTFSFAWVNLPFTLGLVLVVLYWISMILGVAHDSHSDADVDAHADVDGHADLDGHADVDGHADHDGDVDSTGMGAAGILLRFLHAGEVPLTAVLSVLTACMWAEVILGNWWFNPELAPVTALLLLVPETFIALVATRLILIPAAPILRNMHVGVARKAVLIGQIATVKSESVTERTGQAELLQKGVSLLLNVRTKDGLRLSKGDAALIVAHDEARGIYEVTKM